MKPTLRKTLIGVSVVMMAACFTNASAWTDDKQTLDKAKKVNTTCKFEPEAQCSWAVRIDAQAPGVDMREAAMEAMRLDNANLQGANLSYAIIQLASLKNANLMLANLEGAHMHAANLQGANLTMANLTKVNLLDANLTGANLRGAKLEGAILTAAVLDNATWTDGRVCAVGSKGECK